jgi:Holliday junction resolvasome RuvABC ATP-dependent DNA helicase subunit
MFNEMTNFIKAAWPARQYIVPCLVGPAGIGKTAAVKEAAAELGAGKVVTIIASQILPNEVSGITMPVAETKAMEIYDHYRLSSLQDGDILFFDELLEADQLVLSACLTLIESRELMSGHKLPDVMIAAATNPTIKPNMLKENIRQRFVWQEFAIDTADTYQYILKTFGVNLSSQILSLLTDKGDGYNILTPRSLTKMVHWMTESNGDPIRANEIAKQINIVWQSKIGTELAKDYMKQVDGTTQVRNAIKNFVPITDSNNAAVSVLYNDEAFSNTSMSELMEILQKLPQWEKIEAMLSSTVLESEVDESINF